MSILPSLSGCWLLSRSTDDGVSMAGSASFVPKGAGRFDYLEEGRLTLPGGGVLDASRRYVFAERPEGFAVYFAEVPLRLFHDVVLRQRGEFLIGDGIHHCGADRYRSTYRICPGGPFLIEHQVDGPRKRYTIVTRYTRAAEEVALATPPA